jgi:hypothetical protein
MIYKLYCTQIGETTPNAATTVGVTSQVSFIFEPNNTDYLNFKKAIMADEAELKDVDGNTMTSTQAKDYVKELP